MKGMTNLMIFFISFLLYLQLTDQYDAVVAIDGSGNYTRVFDAIAGTPSSSKKYTIKVKQGTYDENVLIPKDKINIVLIGDGRNVTIIRGNRSVSGCNRTYDTATVGVDGMGFVAIDITFRNDAGPENGQAVALRSEVDSAFYRCAFQGYQDTLYAKMSRQFYRECDIYGTVDFIFGDADVILQNCNIYVRKPLHGQVNTITAQGREYPGGKGGIVIHNCIVDAAPEFLPVMAKTYLGRPWKNYSRVIVMQSFLGALVDSKGWLQWGNDTWKSDTLYYAEYDNKGHGAAVGGRVKWPGFALLNTSAEAINFTVRNFLEGFDWIPATRIPFNPDLI